MDAIMLLQQGINLKKNILRVGTTERVLIDINTDDKTSIGRSYRDAPEVDNFIRIDEKLPIGEFIDIKIMEAFEYDVTGESVTYEPETV
jgi:ribosomal protein S12 methylthiotransferase